MNRRALVIAEPAATGFIKRHVKHVTPKEPLPEFVREALPGYRCFTQPPPAAKPFALKNFTSVFFWPLYDDVFVQDCVVSDGNSGYLPLGVANHLFFARGQFSSLGRTRIRPLFVEPALLAAAASLTADGRFQTASLIDQRSELLRQIDVGRLWRPIPDAPREDSPSFVESGARRLSLPGAAKTELEAELRAQLGKERIKLWMIDDEPGWLLDMYESLGGPDGTPAKKNGCFWMLTAGSGTPQIDCIESYSVLRDRLERELTDSFRGLRVVVTDILFSRTLTLSGLDLIRHVRRVDTAANPRTAVIAFTGYGNPLMTAACHHEGADFVVQKAGAYAHGQSATDDAPGVSALVEIFWNVLWLNAVCGFTLARVGHLKAGIEPGPDRVRDLSLPRLVGEIARDIDAVFPARSWFHALKPWRNTISELLDEAVHCARVTATPDRRQSSEINEWRQELARRLEDFTAKTPGRAWI